MHRHSVAYVVTVIYPATPNLIMLCSVLHPCTHRVQCSPLNCCILMYDTCYYNHNVKATLPCMEEAMPAIG